MPRRTTESSMSPARPAPRPSVLGAVPIQVWPVMGRVESGAPSGLYRDSVRPLDAPRVGTLAPEERVHRAMLAFRDVLHAPMAEIPHEFNTRFPEQQYLGRAGDMHLPETMSEILYPGDLQTLRPGSTPEAIRGTARNNVLSALRSLLGSNPFLTTGSQNVIDASLRGRLRYGFECWRRLYSVMRENGTHTVPFEFDVDSQAGFDRTWRVICTGIESAPGPGERSVLLETRLCFLVSEGSSHSLPLPNADRPWTRIAVDIDGFALVHDQAIGPRGASMERPCRVVHLCPHTSPRTYLGTKLAAVAYALMMAPRCIAFASRRRCDFLRGRSSVSMQQIASGEARRLGMGPSTFCDITNCQWPASQRRSRIHQWCTQHRVPTIPSDWHPSHESEPRRALTDLIHCSPFDGQEPMPMFWRDEIGLDPERRPGPTISAQAMNGAAGVHRATSAQAASSAPAWSWTAIPPNVAEIMARDLTLTLEDPEDAQ